MVEIIANKENVVNCPKGGSIDISICKECKYKDMFGSYQGQLSVVCNYPPSKPTDPYNEILERYFEHIHPHYRTELE